MGFLFSQPEPQIITSVDSHNRDERKKVRSKTSKMSEIQNNYWQLLVETRIAIMEESDKYSLMDDENINDKDFIDCHQKTVTTNIIQSLIDGWLSMNSKLLEEKNHWRGLKQAIRNIKAMEKTARTMTNKLVLFQDEQKNVSVYLDGAQQYKSYQRIHEEVNDIHKQLDLYTDEAKSALEAALFVDGVENHRSVQLNWKTDSYHWIFLCLSSRVMHGNNPKGIFDRRYAEKALEKANNMNYWLLLLTTRSKMKVLLIRCTIRKRNVMDLLKKDKIQPDEAGVDSLYTLESTISTYTGLQEWETIKNMNDVSFVVWLNQKCLIKVQKEMSKNINQIEGCKSSEATKLVLDGICICLDKYMEHVQNIMNLIEKAAKQCFQHLY